MNIKHNIFQPPIAQSIHHTKTFHGVEIFDEYHWMRDKSWPVVDNAEIMSYIQEENTYATKILEQHTDLVTAVASEIKSKVTAQDITVPYQDGEYLYYSYICKDDQYWKHCRSGRTDGDIKTTFDAVEMQNEVFLDENILAGTSKYFNMSTYSVSPDGRFVAYAVDYVGNQRYDILIKDIETNTLLSDQITNTMGEVVWSNDNNGIFYIPVNEFWRSEKVCYHQLNTTQSSDVVIFHEIDTTFTVSIRKSHSRKFLFVESESYTESETKYLDLDTTHFSSKSLKTIFVRKSDHIYHVEHGGKYFYIITNDTGSNFRLIRQDIDNSVTEELLGHSDTISIANVLVYKQHIAIESRADGLQHITLFKTDHIDSDFELIHEVQFDEASYYASVIFTTFDSNGMRYEYSSLKTPKIIFEYDFISNKTKQLKSTVLENFSPDDYEVKYEHAITKYTSSDDGNPNNPYLKEGIKIPISIIYKKSITDSAPKPLLLYGYGSYGISIPAKFSPRIFPLLDRGFIYAIAHIRGGGELGRMWYEAGKLSYKKNTFEDFITVAEYLISRNYTSAGNIAIYGGSAGGMLVGYCINERPELYKTALAIVPFVDVLNTMLDDSLPLTPLEFKEWGNPIIAKSVFDYIKSYSPYDNVKQQQYPNLYISAGLYDPRVTYWEPLKWIAKIRASNISSANNIILMQMNTSAGHQGASGRFDYIKELAVENTFLLKVFNKY